jgi:cytochrome c oxidase subunit 2
MEQRIAASAGAIALSGDVSRNISVLHLEAFWLCVAIAIVVVVAMIHSLLEFRRSQGAVRHEMLQSVKIEILWTVIPLLIVVLVAIPAAQLILKTEH